MAGFLDLARVTARDPIKAFYYICGSEILLREEALSLVLKASHAPTTERLHVSATDGATKVWDAINSYADSTDRRLVVVRDAEHLSSWDPFWLLVAALKAKTAPPVTAVLLSSAPTFGEVTNKCQRGHTSPLVTKKARAGKQVQVCEDCATIKAKLVAASTLLYVECSQPTAEAASRLIAGSEADSWPGWASASPQSALELLSFCGGDLIAVRDACRRAEVYGVPVVKKTIPVLAVRGDDEEYVEAITRLATADAARVARSVLDPRRVIGQLERRLDLLARLNRAARRAETIHGLSQQLNVHYKVVEALKPWAKYYDSARVTRDSLVLAQADAVLADGIVDGVLEIVAALW